MRVEKRQRMSVAAVLPSLAVLLLAGCEAGPQYPGCGEDGRAETEHVATSVGNVIFGSYTASLEDNFHGCDDGPSGVYDFSATSAQIDAAIPKLQSAFDCQPYKSDKNALKCQAGRISFMLFLEDKASGRLALTVHE
jgi:hypothetical protein